ncbi:MAG: phosphoglucosamine mutase [Acidobacteria bacterium]|nr:phosphoglucosamine mutase [Acidobacteriota bacterium]
MAYNPFRNFWLKAIAIGIAVLLWFVVGGEKVVERSLRVPLEMQNLPPGLEVVGDSPGSVDVRVRGSSSVLGQLSAGDVVAVLDLSNSRAGRRLLHLAPDHVRVPFGIEVTYVGPGTLPLVLERSSTKVVPVVASVEGDPAAGYTVARVTIEPTEIEVEGPESALRQLTQASTEPIDLDGTTMSVRETVTIGVPNSAARLRSPRSARVFVEIAPVRTERTLATVPVRMLNLRGGLSAQSAPSNVAPSADRRLEGVRRRVHRTRASVNHDQMSITLFGTDGVRGRAGTAPLDQVTIRRLGMALVKALPAASSPPRLLVGRDTRESGAWIERDLALGARSCGAEVVSAGVIPTPAIAHLTRSQEFSAGLVISASHNPFEDNGIKVFSGGGEKFTEKLEAEVEAIVADRSWEAPGGDAPPVPLIDEAEAYLAHARAAMNGRIPAHAKRVAIDCAHGATYELAPRLLRSLGFDVTATGCAPDGRNINLACGSTHPEGLARLVVERACDLGIAFDGDGDRAIFVDHTGRIVDGDAVIHLCATQMQATGRLRGNTVVATVMSNIGLEIALRDRGIGLIRCPVGDKYVMEELLRDNLSLGGEQSGHIIFPDLLFTGDGIVTALSVLRVMAETGRPLADLAGELRTFPQVLVNVRVREKRDWTAIPVVARAASEVESKLAGRGRLLVRYSGTETLLRIMIEGERQDEINAWAEQIAAAVRTEIGQ